MRRENPLLKGEEQIMFALRELYQAYGYQRYQVSKFEEYDFYAQNRDFLGGRQVLAFPDTNGQLMALKPDVTLSVIKNTRPGQLPRKLYYTENVYRAPDNAYGFREIMQTGLEYIGPADLYTMGEVVLLAAKSLNAISPEYVLYLSHLGVISAVLEASSLSPEERAAALLRLGERSLHGLWALDIPGETKELLAALAALHGPFAPVLKEAAALPLPRAAQEALAQLTDLCRLTERFGCGRVELDLSLVNNMEYYQGLIFQGFVNGIPNRVLSGGRYDPLLRKMGKPGAAIGFAVYLDQLDRLDGGNRGPDVDVLLSYTADTAAETVFRTAERLLAAGKSVRVQQDPPRELTFGAHLHLQGEEVTTLETFT